MNLETLSREELISSLQKLKGHASQLFGEKKIAEELFAVASKERDDIKLKAVGVVKRCKELEDRNKALEADMQLHQVSEYIFVDV